MPELSFLKHDAFILCLLTPIQDTISLILPAFIKDQLEKDEVRERIVDEVDKNVIPTYPQAMMVPPETRRKRIRKTLDMMLDDILQADPD